jgi:hypothetical protein
MTPEQESAAVKYVGRIRNPKKRAYALSYLRFLNGLGPEPDRGQLSYMAAQAVRIELAQLTGYNGR